MVRWVCSAALLAALVGCDDGDTEPPPPTGNLEILAEGTGPANELPLWPVRSGTVMQFRRAAVRPPIEIAAGRVAYRYITQPNTVPGETNVSTQNEVYVSIDEDGYWFEGTARHGLQEAPIMLVPQEARVGMRWRTGGGAEARVYEVTETFEQVVPTVGPTTFWRIVQETENPIHRLYAEGWGLIAIGEGGSPNVPNLAESLRAVTGTTEEPAQDTGPTLALTPVEGVYENLLNQIRVDTVRAVEYDDAGRVTLLNVVGVGRGVGRPDGIYSEELALRDGTFSTFADRVAHLPSTGREGHWGLGASYWSGPGSIFGVGNVHFLGGTPIWSVEDFLMFENAVGGLSAVYLHSPGAIQNRRNELTVRSPGHAAQGSGGGRPIWGTFSVRSIMAPQLRVLIGNGADADTVPFASMHDRHMGGLWNARLLSVPHGRYLDVGEFVEAFPDVLGTDNSRFRGPMIDTTTRDGHQSHFVTTPGGVIDRLVVDAMGARRERVGRVALPDGHVLRAVAEAPDGSLVVFTYAPDSERPLTGVWTAEARGSAPVDPAPFVNLEWSHWDLRVCWPSTAEPLDGAEWRLGPVPAAAVIPLGDNCALVVRDLEAAPLVDGAPAGWEVFEGDVPGVGHLRAYEPGMGFTGSTAPTDGAWVTGGGIIGSEGRFAPGGIYRGEPVFGGGDVPDQSGAGVWGATSLTDYPDGDCDITCTPPRVTALTLSGPTPRYFDALMSGPVVHAPVRSGGVIASGFEADGTQHTDPAWVRPDGTVTPLTAPSGYDSATLMLVRASGEVCGHGTTGGSPFVFCAQPDGSGLREVATMVTTTPTALGGWQMLDDDTAFVAGPAAVGEELWLLDLGTLDASAYPGAVRASDLGSVGADGVLYGANTGELGAFAATGFVPLSAIYDVEALFAPGFTQGDLTALIVGEQVVTIRHGFHTLRVPRDRWNSP